MTVLLCKHTHIYNTASRSRPWLVSKEHHDDNRRNKIYILVNSVCSSTAQRISWSLCHGRHLVTTIALSKDRSPPIGISTFALSFSPLNIHRPIFFISELPYIPEIFYNNLVLTAINVLTFLLNKIKETCLLNIKQKQVRRKEASEMNFSR